MSLVLNYFPCASAHLYHTIKGSENDYGVQAIIVRQYQPLPAAFAVDAAKVQRLLEGKSQLPKALVFLQVCEPGSNFGPYESTAHRLVMTSSNYLKLLHFFSQDWDRTYLRMQDEVNKMRENKHWVKIAPNLFFMGHGAIHYNQPLDDKLNVTVRCSSDSNLLTAYLEYSDELLGTCPLYIRCFSIMANNRAILERILSECTAANTVNPTLTANPTTHETIALTSALPAGITATVHHRNNLPVLPSLPRLLSPMSSAGSTAGDVQQQQQPLQSQQLPSHNSIYKESTVRTVQF